MPELTLGLAPGKNGYFDPITNFYLSLDKPVQKLTYTEPKQLEKITHALLATVPALTLYSGELPQEAVDAFKAKYEKIFRSPTTKNIVENGKVIGQVPVADPIRNGMDQTGRPIEPNRAYDRADEVPTVAPVAPVSEGEAEQVELFSTEAEVEVQEEAPKKRSARAKKD